MDVTRARKLLNWGVFNKKNEVLDSRAVEISCMFSGCSGFVRRGGGAATPVSSATVVVVVVFFTLTDRASTIPSNVPVSGCQSATWSAGQYSYCFRMLVSTTYTYGRSYRNSASIAARVSFFFFVLPFFSFFLYLFGDVAFSEYFLYHFPAFSLYREYVVRAFFPNGVFLPCDQDVRVLINNLCIHVFLLYPLNS